MSSVPPLKQTKPPPAVKSGTKEEGPDAKKDQVTSAKSASIWDTYMDMAKPKDGATLDEWEGLLDVTLVFASLFSAISTGFILASLNDLRSDPARDTAMAIHQLIIAIHMLHPSTEDSGGQLSPTVPEASRRLGPTTVGIWVNCLWYMSLGLSISVSLFAMLAKMWCYKTRIKYKGTQYDRVVERQRTWAAVERWNMELFIVQLPVLMHMAVIIFIIGLVLYLSEIHRTAMIAAAIPIVGTVLVYLGLTFLQALEPNCPMGTPFTPLLQTGISQLPSITWSLKQGNAMKMNLFNFKALLPDKKDPTGQSPITPTPRCHETHSASSKLSSTERKNMDHNSSFQALLWLLLNSNDKKIVTAVLEHVSSFPEVILLSDAGGSELSKAVTILCNHIRRMRLDTIEWYNANDMKFIWGCDNFMYLAARPWLHCGPNDDNLSLIEGMTKKHLPKFSSRAYVPEDLSLERLNDQLNALNERKKTLGERKKESDKQKEGLNEPKRSPAKQKKRSTKSMIAIPGGLPWLERSAIYLALDILAKHGLTMCKELWEFISTYDKPEALLDHRYLALWWIFLNCVMDCRDSRGRKGAYFWPTSMYGGRDSQFGADGALTLIHFRHADDRETHGIWLTLVGISSLLHVFAQEGFRQHDASPFNLKDENSSYFESLTTILEITLKMPTKPEEYNHDLPVYNLETGKGTSPHTINALQYCQAAIASIGESSACKESTICETLNNLKKLLDSKLQEQLQTSSQPGKWMPSQPVAPSELLNEAEMGLFHSQAGPSIPNAITA